MIRITSSLGFRLFFLILLIGCVVFLLLASLTIRVNSNHLMDQIVASANRTNNLIKGSTYYSMLQNRKEDVYQIISTLGRQPGVEGIRIYNKSGIITFSTNNKEIGKAVDLKAEQCIVCHTGTRPLDFVPEATRPRIFDSPKGYRVLAMINPIPNEKACSEPGCHQPPSKQKILGVFDVKMSLAGVDKAIAQSRNRMILYSILAIIIIEFFTGIFIWYMVHKRVQKLSDGTRQVANGNLDFQMKVSGRDEIGNLAWSFNQMVKDLQKAQEEITDWSLTLENKVEKKTEELKRAQEQMVNVAKMASMGKLSATVAHEINNPLSGILTYNKLLLRRLKSGTFTEEDRKIVVQQLQSVINEVKRCGKIVQNMLLFTKDSRLEFKQVDFHAVIEESLFIINHHLEINSIKLIRKLDAADPLINGDNNQLKQALIAIFVNAVEAMSPDGGTMKVKTFESKEKDALVLQVVDTGKGIPDDIQTQIFEPFFSTKEESHSVGLGLSVVYGIVLRHGGHIDVKSRPNRGTTITINLPRKAEKGNKGTA